MMPNVVRGDRMAGLMTYLVGDGKRNEHTEPHVVAGDAAIMAWYGDTELSRDSGLQIARHLDLPQRTFDADVPGGHVWHCSLSLRAEEGMLTDEKWGEIARDFMVLMDFDDPASPKEPTRWAAVRHGVSQNGNDHIHLVVNLVREDGTKANIHNDFHRAQQAARALEVKYGLETLESVNAERSTRGYDPAEMEAQSRARAQRRHELAHQADPANVPAWTQLPALERQQKIRAEVRTDQPRYELARTVRACAAASQDEAEFVRRARRSGLLLRPRFAEGTQDVVVGYSVARRPEVGERPIWYGGGHLGRDLTLPRLRAEWPDTPTGATEAAAEWNAAYRGRRVVSVGRENDEHDPEMLGALSEQLRDVRQQLGSVPLDDRETWARVARHTAGALAAWSKATEDQPGDLAHASDVLARSAQTWHAPIKPKPTGMLSSFTGTAMLLAASAQGGRGVAAQMAVARQLGNLVRTIFDAAQAAGDLRQATAIRDAHSTNLHQVHERLAAFEKAQAHVHVPAAPAPVLDPEVQATLDRLNATRGARPGTNSPLPTQLPERATARPLSPKHDRGIER